MSRPCQASNFRHCQRKQRGAALMIMLVILVMGAATILVSSLSSSALQIGRDKITADALAQAKAALIGYAASVDLTNPSAASPRPGNLPCPDNHPPGSLEGTPSSPCSGSTLVGRLPWKTLGLPDLRDSSGERLWYAVSSNFKKSTPYTCTAPGLPGCLNSDTAGTITIRSSDSSIIYDASLGNGVAAIIIAPGDVLQRTDKTTLQDRSSAGYNNAQNYLDIALGEDNTDFVDGSSTNGFIQGKIKDNSGNVILNDQLLVITQDNIMQVIQKRVAAEVKQCLNEYAINSQNMGRYPWAVPQTDLTNYQDFNQLFGRIPDTPFTNSCLSSGGYASGHGTNNCTDTPTVGMKNTWTGNCNINSSSGWWLNWKEMVFYGLADAYKPVDPLTTPIDPPAVPNACTTGACLSVNPPSATADKKFVVIVAGKKLATTIPAQARTNNADKGTPSNYLEAPNNGGATAFAQGAFSATFNDTVVFP